MAEGGVTDVDAQTAILTDTAPLEMQKNELKELLKKTLKKDDKWFVIVQYLILIVAIFNCCSSVIVQHFFVVTFAFAVHHKVSKTF